MSPIKSKKTRCLLRESTGDSESPSTESKKTINIIPSKTKTTKITTSDLVTPKETNRLVEFKNLICNADGFSDMHSIIKDHNKKPSDDKTPPPSESVKPVVRSIRSAMMNRNPRLCKAASQII